MFNNDNNHIIKANLDKSELSIVKTEVVLASQGFLISDTKVCKLGKIIMYKGAFENCDCLDYKQKQNLIVQVNNVIK